MHTPQDNAEGYQKSAITNMTALNGTTRFLIAHGTADDNVHVQNTYSLLDKLDMAEVENFDLLIYPDSAHDITARHAEKMIYQRKAVSPQHMVLD